MHQHKTAEEWPGGGRSCNMHPNRFWKQGLVTSNITVQIIQIIK